MMYAMVEIKGKQYRAEKGAVLKVDKLEEEAGGKVEFDSVLLVNDNGAVSLGAPYVQGVKISGVVEEHGRDRKIIIYKYKRRKKYRRRMGHRQHFSIIKVEDITGIK